MRYYLYISDEVEGPYELEEIKGRALPQDTLVCREGEDVWYALSNLQQLIPTSERPIEEEEALLYNEASLFPLSDRTWGKKQLAKKRNRYLGKNIPILRRVLAPQEQILYLTPCIENTCLKEHLFLGGWTLYTIKRCLFIVTPKRVLIFFITLSGHIGSLRYQIEIQRIRESVVHKKWGKGILELILKGGGKRRWIGLPYQETRRCSDQIKRSLVGQQDTAPLQPILEKDALDQICIYCHRPMRFREEQCYHCGLMYKTLQDVKRKGFILPGWGSFPLHHPLLGLLELLVWLLLLAYGGYTGVALFNNRDGSHLIHFGISLLLLLGHHLITGLRSQILFSLEAIPKKIFPTAV